MAFPSEPLKPLTRQQPSDDSRGVSTTNSFSKLAFSISSSFRFSTLRRSTLCLATETAQRGWVNIPSHRAATRPILAAAAPCPRALGASLLLRELSCSRILACNAEITLGWARLSEVVDLLSIEAESCIGRRQHITPKTLSLGFSRENGTFTMCLYNGCVCDPVAFWVTVLKACNLQDLTIKQGLNFKFVK